MEQAKLRKIEQEAQKLATEDISVVQVERFNTKLQKAVLYSICESLDREGFFENDDKIFLANNWIPLLEKEGLIKKEGNIWRTIFQIESIDMLWNEFNSPDLIVMIPAEAVAYIRVHAEHFTSLLRGDFSGMKFLFPEGVTDIAEKIYGETAINRFLNQTIAEIINMLAEKNQLHILEVGGGVGATTEKVLERLKNKNFNYRFTDVSLFFLNNIKRKYPILDTAILDLDTMLVSELDEKYNIIIAAGVLNSVKNIPNVAKKLVNMLDGDGVLFITEPVQEHIEIDVTQGFIQQNFTDFRKSTGRWYLTIDEWIKLFEGLNCEIEIIPENQEAYAKLGYGLLVVHHMDEQNFEL